MRRAALLLGGLLAGFVAGSILPGSHLAATIGPSTVSWTASNCPVGVYTITSTAIAFKGGGSFVTTSSGVQLPKNTVTQFFDNMPPGKYAVSAVARAADGNEFRSGTQLLQPATAPSASAFAVRQPTRSAPTRQSGSRPGPGIRSTPAQDPPLTVADAPTPKPDVTSFAIKLDRLADGLGDGSEWRRFDLLDLDEDGAVDVMRIEWMSGAVAVVRVLTNASVR